MSAAPDNARRGIMLVVSSPSGAGKTTLTRNLLAKEKNISLSVSVTTRRREARPGLPLHSKIPVPEDESER